MGERFAKQTDCDSVHAELNKSLLKLTEDVGYIKGKVDTLVDSHKELRDNNSDWWSRIIAGLALALAWMKGA